MNKLEFYDEALEKAGILAQAARAIVGGKSIEGAIYPSCTLSSLPELLDALKKATDAYDKAILAEVMSRSKKERP